MAITKNEVLEWIDQATMLDISDLVKSLEDKYGISAAAAMPVAVGGMPAGKDRIYGGSQRHWRKKDQRDQSGP